MRDCAGGIINFFPLTSNVSLSCPPTFSICSQSGNINKMCIRDRYDTLMSQKPEKARELAVKGMLPSNTIGRAALLRLRVFAGAEHKHQAQKPEALDLSLIHIFKRKNFCGVINFL